MSKYTKEFKLKVVNCYLEGKNGGYEQIAKDFLIPSTLTVRKWIKKYKDHGIEGLIRNNIKYDGQFKVNVVEYMHTNHLSLIETCIKFNLGSHSVVGKWERIYYEEGPQALFKEKRGRSKNMSSKRKLSPQIEEDLINENQRLRMEIAYLKKLRALVQERENRENQTKHKPSAN